MKPRALTLALALAALGLFYVLLFPKPISILEPTSLPLSTDSGEDGLLAAWRWLQAEAIPVLSLRNRYDHLSSTAIGGAGAGNVLITLMPHRLAVRAEEWQPLARWVEQGNTLLVMAALDDTPRWTLGLQSSFVVELQRATHMTFDIKTAQNPKPSQTQQVEDTLSALLGPTVIPIIPRGAHALLSEVRNLRAVSDLPASRWRAEPVDGSTPLTLAQRADNLDPVLWLMRQGEGQVLVLAVASPFANREIALSNNARLLSNIIGWSRAPQGKVLFDDAHQGLVDFYDPRAFFHDPRLHRTLAWSVLLWLAFVLGPLRLASAYSPWQPVDESALIDASGRFFSVAVAPHEAARRLFENFFDELRRRLGLPENGEPLWGWLDTQAGFSSRERTLLQSMFARVYASERVDLTRLHNLLCELRGKLS
jgi:hypothetical protein